MKAQCARMTPPHPGNHYAPATVAQEASSRALTRAKTAAKRSAGDGPVVTCRKLGSSTGWSAGQTTQTVGACLCRQLTQSQRLHRTQHRSAALPVEPTREAAESAAAATSQETKFRPQEKHPSAAAARITR